MKNEGFKLREFCDKYRGGGFLDEEMDELAKVWKVVKGIQSDYILDNFNISLSHTLVPGQMPAELEGTAYDNVLFSPNKWVRYGFFALKLNDRRYGRYAIFMVRNGICYVMDFQDVRNIRKFINTWGNMKLDAGFFIKQAKEIKRVRNRQV